MDERPEFIEKFIESGALVPGYMTTEEMLRSLKTSEEEELGPYEEATESFEEEMGRKPLGREEVLDYILAGESSFGEIIDERMRSIIWDINQAGYGTSESCQGGAGRHWNNAFITVLVEDLTPQDRNALRQIVKRYTSTPFRIYKGYHTEQDIWEDDDLVTILFRGAF